MSNTSYLQVIYCTIWVQSNNLRAILYNEFVSSQSDACSQMISTRLLLPPRPHPNSGQKSLPTCPIGHIRHHSVDPTAISTKAVPGCLTSLIQLSKPSISTMTAVEPPPLQAFNTSSFQHSKRSALQAINSSSRRMCIHVPSQTNLSTNVR